MYLYVFLNVIIALIGIFAVMYLLFRIFSWKQGDARFIIEARRREPFRLKSLTDATAVFETEVPFHNGGRQLGTIMDFYPRTLLPREQYDLVTVSAQLANKAAMTDIGKPLFTILITAAVFVLPSHSRARAATSVKICACFPICRLTSYIKPFPAANGISTKLVLR